MKRRNFIFGSLAALSFPKEVLAEISKGLVEDTTRSLVPDWANYGLAEEEKKTGFYRIFHDVDSKDGDPISEIADLYGISQNNIKTQTGFKGSVVPLGTRLMLKVPVENFEGYVPYNDDENRNKIISLTGDNVADLVNEIGHKRLSLLLGYDTGYLDVNNIGTRIEELVRDCGSAATTNGIHLSLYQALVTKESKGFKWATSEHGALGVCQLKPAIFAGEDWSDGVYRIPINPFDTFACSYRGCEFLALLIDNCRGNIETALARYHDGESKKVLSQTARNYARDVMKIAKENGFF